MRARYLGPGWELAQDPRHPLQHGRRPHHGARDRRAALRQLVGLPFGGVGHQRAALRRPHGRRPVPEAQLSVRHPRSTPRASATSTRAPTSTAIPMRNMAARSCEQPGMFAWQVFDAKVTHLLRGEYRIRRVTKAEANTLEELAPKLDGVDAASVPAYGARVQCRLPRSTCRSIPTCWMAAARKAWRSTRPTGPTRSIPRRTTPIK